ncbi:MAG TPA: hypothetical protein PK479_09465, partial [Novosphingobium sp.]|nr:hypothetical protein [Novosphingobium sp.]
EWYKKAMPNLLILEQQTLTATANSDALTAVYINPTFSDGAYSSVAHNGLIVASGNVGIGSTTPSVALDVVGAIKGTTTATLGAAGGTAGRSAHAAGPLVLSGSTGWCVSGSRMARPE